MAPVADIGRASSLCLSPPAGEIAAILGTEAHRLALRALARPLLAGEAAVAVDGGHLFDPYEISREERALGGSGKTALSRIRISRAFTCHQMEALLSGRLPAALSRSGARLALVLGLPETFADADVPWPEACRLFRASLSALRRTARGGVRVIVAGPENPGRDPGFPVRGLPEASSSRDGFFRHIARIADPLLLLRREEGELRWTLRSARKAEEGGS
jgi:hypothetical protein